MITSTQNQRIKHLLLLQQKSAQRRADGLFVVEGRREVEHCLSAGFTIKTAFVCEEIVDSQVSLPQGVEVVLVSQNVYERIAYRGGTEGIVAVVAVRQTKLSDLKLSPSPLIVVLESVEKPGNLGAVLRSADAAGADAVVVCDPLTDLFNPNLIRSAVGAIFTVPCVACSTEECIAFFIDPLRFYLCKEMPTTEDGLFTYERFIEQYNVYLANDLGNLVSRSIAMVNKYFGGTIERCASTSLNKDANEQLEKIISENTKKYLDYMESFQLQNGINAIFEIVGFANKYIDLTTPWVLAKDEALKNELNDCLYHLLETLRLVTIMLQPFMPDTTNTIFEELGVTDKSFASLTFGKNCKYTVIEKAIVLFKRLDLAEEYKKYGISE